MPLDPQQVGKRLTEIRGLQGRSLSEVAEAAGIAKSYLLKLERGEVENPGLATLDLIAKELKVTLAKLLDAKYIPGQGTRPEIENWETIEARMPESLKEFVRQREDRGEKIPVDLKKAMAGIRLRGKHPENWELIYHAVKASMEKR